MPNTEIIRKIKRRFEYMKRRCYDLKYVGYKHYGGRGITVCDEWLTSPDSFVEWALENGFKTELTIERIDVNKGYSPDDCTWIAPNLQYFNRTDSVTDLVAKTRKCQKCQIIKPLTEFHVNTSKPLGRRYVCKHCRNRK